VLIFFLINQPLWRGAMETVKILSILRLFG
jgi:hypothetical protein